MDECEPYTLHGTDVMTAVVETDDDDMYLLPNMLVIKVLEALNVGSASASALSMVNLNHAAMVVPWRLLARVSLTHGAGLRDNQAVLIWEKAQGSVVQVISE